MKRVLFLIVIIVLITSSFVACGGGDEPTPTQAPTATTATGGDAAQSAPAASGNQQAAAPAEGALPAAAMAIAQARGLTPDDINAALKTFVPSGKWDEYYMFTSGGHSGNLIVIGVPSMRILKNIAVFTPESWQGYGVGSKDTEAVLDGGNVDGVKIRSGDTHHPGLSETAGDYDGQFVFINDKTNARIAVVDLRDFETKQILKDPNVISNHGSTFVTPNTDYVMMATQYATPLGWDYAPIEEYQAKYRGLLTLWKFDRTTGRIKPEESFAIELPPYWQDLCDAGKLVSDGWGFCNSINTEMATGGIEEGNPPFEAGVSQRDTDYLHIFNWKKAEEVYKAGKGEVINGMAVIRMPTAVAEGILYLAPEPKSPHGADVTPDGKYIVVAGKLDPHVTIYSFDLIQKAIADKKWEADPFGIPVLNFDAVKHAQVELGLGPLHTQFDDKGFAYTSLFLDSAVAKWKWGSDNPADWQMVEKTPVQYNIGHISAAEGDTVNPDGHYLVALNKWAVDRFLPVGPLLPQNEQLLDIGGDKPQVIYDMAMGVGEPHYAQMIKADKIKAWEVYPEVGWDPIKNAKSEFATNVGEEKVITNGNTVEVFMTAVRSHLTPEHVKIKKGNHVIWHITNIETAHDATHGFQLGGYNISLSIEPGETTTFEFDAVNDGTYAYYCTEFCSALHLEMMGYMLVEPSSRQAVGGNMTTMSNNLEQIIGPRVPEREFRAHRTRYLLPTLLFILAALLLLVSIFQPYWKLTLHAPQYPKGLHVLAYLNQLEGDVKEIDGLNHYIGMRPLNEAATFERSISIAGVVVLGLLIAAAVFVHTRWAALLALPALLFPAIFLADLQYWLANFGQNLDPHAALSSSIKPFVPPVLGTGKIAQFSTDAIPQMGLWLAVTASLIILIGLWFHRRAYKPLVDQQSVGHNLV